MLIGLRVAAVMTILMMVGPSAAGASAGELTQSCVQPPAGANVAVAPAANGWTYLYQGVPRGRLWRWTGARWVSAGKAAPAVSLPTMAPDPSGPGLILLGTTETSPDHRVHLGMWRWRKGKWTRLHPRMFPSAGYFSVELSLAMDRVHHTLLLSETVSNDAYAVHNELWLWAGKTWKRVASDSPGAITGSTVPYPIATGPGGAVWGFQGTIFNVTQLVRWNGATLEPVTATGGPKAVAALGWDPVGNRLIVLGGTRQPIPDVPFPTTTTFEFDGSAWISTRLPRGLREWTQMLVAADPKQRAVVLWGGQHSYGFIRSHPKPAAFPATWRWSGRQWVKSETACQSHR